MNLLFNKISITLKHSVLQCRNGNYIYIRQSGKRPITNNIMNNNRNYFASRKSSSSHQQSLILNEDLKVFMSLYPDIVQELVTHANNYTKTIGEWFQRSLNYNTLDGKKYRSLLMISVYKSLVRDVTSENMKLVNILAWCIQMHHSCMLIYDDIMDDSITRRKQLCWHKFADIGLTGLNDGLMLEQSVYYLLRKYFHHMNCYVDLIDLFHDVSFITACGQALDVRTSKESIQTFTWKKYHDIVLHKTAYCFSMPIDCAMYLAGPALIDSNIFKEYKALILEMSIMFQVQDDYLDCFGKEEITGKIGTDIKDNKCTWLAVECMHRANENQKAIMLECYGSYHPDKIARIKELYVNLDLPAAFRDHQNKTFNQIQQSIKRTSHAELKKVAQTIYETFSQRLL